MLNYKSNAEQNLLRITDGSPVAAFVIDSEHKVIHWNRAIEALTGIKRIEVIGTSEHRRAFYNTEKIILADLIVNGASEADILARYPGRAKKSQLIEGAFESEDYFPTLSTDGGAWLRFTASPIKDDDGKTIGAIETLENVTEAKRLFDNQQYYLREVTRAQEEERKRVARELHDSTAQNLIVLLHQLENLLDDKVNMPLSQAKNLWGIYERTRDILQEVRRFSRDLRPSILDDLGLLPALDWLTEEFKANYGVECAIQKNGEERRLTPEAELLVFRIVQESLNNIVKHAHASRAAVKVEFTQNKFSVIVSDDGRGFDPPKNLGELAQVGKLGLAGIAERAQLLGGTLFISSAPGKGTDIRVETTI